MKRSLCLFLALVSLSFESSPTPSTALLPLSLTAKKSVFFGIIALLGASLAKAIHLKYSADLEKFKEKAQRDPFPDSPETRKIAKELTKEGYEVYFAKRSWRSTPGVFSCGKKVVFAIPYTNEQDTFFTDPRYASYREAIIAHEICHARNGDIIQKAYFQVIVSVILSCAAIKLARAGTTTLLQSPLFSSLLIGSPVIKKTSDFALHASAILITSAISCGLSLLTNGAFCQYQEQRADAAAVTLQDPLQLDGIAHYFEEDSKSDLPNKTWKDWFFNKIQNHPSNISRALFFRKEATKMRNKKMRI